MRWPLEPLLAPSGLDPRAFAQRHGIRHQSIDQAATDGLTDQQADRWATRAGYHPVCIWGWAWIDAGLTAGQINHPDKRTQAVA